MSDQYVLDTHSLIWHLEGNPRLSPNARAAISDPNGLLFLPAVALAEACWIVERGKSTIPSVANLLFHIDTEARLAVVPLERETFDFALGLTILNDMHDRLIVATVLRLAAAGGSATLITRDLAIHQSGLVPVLW